MTKNPDSPILKVLFASLAVGLLSGCASNFAPSAIQPNETPIGNIQGSVHGGQAPVTGAQIYLFAAGTTAYGTNATSLIRSSTCNPATGNVNPALNNACFVTTDANGDFQLGGEYTCTEGTQVYMVAMGGNPGQTGTVDNTSIMQMAGLGECPAAGNLAAQVPFLVINEVTTVAFAYSMSGFATTPFNVSSNALNSAASATAIANAMANTGNIVNLQFGQAPATVNGNPNSVNPVSKIYALANILATCVNTSAPKSPTCTALFNAAKDSLGNPATDEASAIFNIAHNQGQNVQTIWNLTSTTPVFSPTLGTQPLDWTIPVIYNNAISVLATNNNSYVSGAFGMAFDAQGNAWIGDRAQGVVEIGPQGAITPFTNNAKGFSMVKGVAVSPQDGSLWVTDFGNNDMVVMDSSGTKLATITQDVAGHGPDSTAFGLNPMVTPIGNGFLAYEAVESSTGIVAYDAGSFAADKNVTTNFANLSSPGWITVDSNGAAWIPSLGSAQIGGLTGSNKNGTLTFTASTHGLQESYLAIADGLGNVWVPLNSTTNTQQLFQVKAGVAQASFGNNNNHGGMNLPWRGAVDGNNVVWLANLQANTISGFSAPTTSFLSTAGFGTSATNGTAGVAAIGVDTSGNVWAANANGSVTELLGLGTPAAAPIYGGGTVTTTTGTGRNAVTTTTVTPGNIGTKP